MTNMWLTVSLWIGLALVASLISLRVGISVALIEIVVGAGAILLTFLAGAEIDLC
ncbi:MAG: sodium:proton antiporter [Deltaproteobacteria bacterium]|nr:sodium:proton antiporter [Deltaproteobacteria bacterium]MCL5276846.1 sodium:proton antiporter [Deltaproteobacteria bacterium]